MLLKDEKTGSTIEISIPDLSGELFRLQWSTRKVPVTYSSFARECTGAFLFIHPDEVKKTHAIKAATENSENGGAHDGPRIMPSENWTAEQTSTQVQLVDIVQSLLRMREIAEPMRMVVIISAWDIIKARISPLGWLDSRLPLLSQFLRANQNYFASEIFGVSAQGGDLISDRDDLLKNATPSTRCRALQGDNNIDLISITGPLRFLLDTHQ